MMRTRTRTVPAVAGLLLVGSGVAACAPDAPDASPGTTPPGPTASATPSASSAPPSPATSTARPARPSPTGPFGRSSLAFFDDCPALLAHLQGEARERVTAHGLHGGWWYGPAGGDLVATTAAAAEESATDGSGRAAAPQADVDYSTTNTQEAGIDEGDVVETDGVHVYTVVQDGLRVVDVASADVVARTPLPAGDHQLILDGDRLVVASQGWTSTEDTIVSLFDVTDASAPVLLRRTHLEGRLVASRAADGTVRLVLSSSLQERLPFVQPQMFGLDEERALEQNRRIVDESSVQDWLPRWFDEDVASGAFGEMQPALDCRDVAAPSEFSGLGVSWIASIDLDADAVPVGSAGIVSTGETVYASSSSLYVATVPWDWQAMPVDDRVDPQRDGPPPTQVHAFSLDDGAGASYRASGAVEGALLNQFAMSEHEGTLRVATTVTGWDTGDSESFVHTLAADTMAPIASIGGLGRGEQIRAVRYLGPTAYVVTFRQIDPLYVLDLSDPAAPVLQGELKIPGYSAYLHPVGDGLLLGVGQDATEEGRALGTQLSLFDVSDPTAPQRISTLAIGGWSDVEWDHRAFLYWPQDGTIVLPASPGWSQCGDEQQLAPDCLASRITSPAGGVVVARLVDRSLEPVGVVEHDAQGSSGCWNPLRRSIVIGTELVTVGLDQVRFSDRTTLSERDTARIGDAEQYGCAWYVEG